MKRLAEEILAAHRAWEDIDKELLLDNLQFAIMRSEKYRLCTLHEFFVEVTGVTKHTAYAWINSGREDVKVPFLKLCQISVALGVDLQSILAMN